MAVRLLARILVVVACVAAVVVSVIARDSRLAEERAYKAYFQRTDTSTALRDLDKAEALNPNYGIDLARARIQPERGPAILEQAVRKEPDNGELWLLLAELQRNAGNEDAARRAYLRARELAPRLPPYTPPRRP